MKIYALQTGIVRVKQFQLTGASNNLSRLYQLLFTQKWSAWMPIYSWLIELDNQLILVDTGETADIFKAGYLPKGGLFHRAVQTRIKREEEISHQITSLGFQLEDVKTILLTHLHGDHAGGIQHFPHADFWVSKTEYEMATSKKGASNGYFPKNWPNWFQPQLISYTNQRVGGFSQSFPLPHREEIIVVPTPGHSAGHQSVILKTDTATFFIGGDLTYNLQTLQSEIPNTVLMNQAAKESVKKARNYVEANACIYLSSHDWNAPQLLTI
ncbi:MAG: N-acyl homoserine lactonase family protein [Bacteroidota bacterium]